MVVLPSRHESSPISILEAAASGKSVIISDIDELRFVAENGFGITFPSESVDGLRVKIELLLENDEMRYHIGLRGREFAKKFMWDSIALEFEKVLSDTD